MHDRRREQRQRRGPGADPMLIMMLMQLWQQIDRLPAKPPVTLALVGFMVVIHLDPSVVPLLGRPFQDMCLQPAAILGGRDSALRLVGSSLVHGSNHHLYYNMASFLWKGVHLEQHMGSQQFAVLVGAMLLLSHSLVVAVAHVAAGLGFGDWLGSCAVGFSAVIFALKFILNQVEGTSNVWGFHVPTRYATWLELVIISLISPHASFLGHLCGIFAGVLYHYAWPVLLYHWRQNQQQQQRYRQQQYRQEAPPRATGRDPRGPPPAYTPRTTNTRYTYTASATGTRSGGAGTGTAGTGAHRRWNFENQID